MNENPAKRTKNGVGAKPIPQQLPFKQNLCPVKPAARCPHSKIGHTTTICYICLLSFYSLLNLILPPLSIQPFRSLSSFLKLKFKLLPLKKKKHTHNSHNYFILFVIFLYLSLSLTLILKKKYISSRSRCVCTPMRFLLCFQQQQLFKIHLVMLCINTPRDTTMPRKICLRIKLNTHPFHNSPQLTISTTNL